MNKITRNCEVCDAGFETRQIDIDRGYGKFCSLSCSSKHHAAQRKLSQVPNCTCANCGKVFYRNATKRSLSKSGLQFCCRTCKDKAQRINGFKQLHPPHYGNGDGRNTYRKRAFESYSHKCMDCGYQNIPEVLEVHHVDGNHSNSNIENLAVLCPTCHQERHFKEKTGRWAKKFRASETP